MEEYLLRRDQASLIARHQTSGNDAKSLLADPISDPLLTSLNDPRGKKAVKRCHQAKLRKQLHDLQIQKARLDSDAERKRLEKTYLQELEKREKFGHVKAKVFDGDSGHDSIQASSSNVMSSAGSLSKLSLVDAGRPTSVEKMRGAVINKQLHDYYGRVPDYILRRQIEEAKKLEQKVVLVEGDLSSNREHNHDLLHQNDHGKENHPPPAFNRRLDKKKLREEYEIKINRVRDSLRKLPFGLQSQGSIRKRQSLEVDLRRMEQEMRVMMKR